MGLLKLLSHKGRKVAVERRAKLPNSRRVAAVESLEPRLLLFAPNGGAWPHPELVTVSFMPDGTDIGGVPSNLFSKMNARWSTGTWQREMLKGVQSFAAQTNLNIGLSSDNGAPFGSCGGGDCNLQGDSSFGDIRIGGLDLGGALGFSMSPPPTNGDTTAGDFFLDTTAAWNIAQTFDLSTVSAHESGHSLGLDHSPVTTAVMFPTYLGIKLPMLDDIVGIRSIYGPRAHDSFDAADPNNTKGDASVITSYIDGNKQITLTNLDLTTSSDVDWYKVATPGGNSGTMTVKVQSMGLSLLAPKVTIMKGSTQKDLETGPYHSTVSSIQSIGGGQNWFVKVEAADPAFAVGRYALQINMGTGQLPPVTSPNTATPVTGAGGSGAAVIPDSHDHGADNFHGHSHTNSEAAADSDAFAGYPWMTDTGASDSQFESAADLGTSLNEIDTQANHPAANETTASWVGTSEESYCKSTSRTSPAQSELVDAVLPSLFAW
jgi:hypothetical protein